MNEIIKTPVVPVPPTPVVTTAVVPVAPKPPAPAPVAPTTVPKPPEPVVVPPKVIEAQIKAVVAPVEDKSKPGPKNIDWIAAKQYYLESFTRTYADVAEKFEVSSRAVEEKGSEESWVKLRKDLGEKALEEFESNKVLEIANANRSHLDKYRILMGMVSKKLIEMSKLESLVIKSKDLKSLADALEKSINGERLILGLPTSVSKSEIMGKLTTDLALSSEQVTSMDKFFKDEKPE